MWNLRNKTKKQRKKQRERERGRDKPKSRLLTIENKLMVTSRMGGWVKQVMGIKKCTCNEQWVLYGSVESLNSTAKTNITLYVNLLEFK